jgi:hypothetical protein
VRLPPLARTVPAMMEDSRTPCLQKQRGHCVPFPTVSKTTILRLPCLQAAVVERCRILVAHWCKSFYSWWNILQTRLVLSGFRLFRAINLNVWGITVGRTVPRRCRRTRRVDPCATLCFRRGSQGSTGNRIRAACAQSCDQCSTRKGHSAAPCRSRRTAGRLRLSTVWSR